MCNRSVHGMQANIQMSIGGRKSLQESEEWKSMASYLKCLRTAQRQLYLNSIKFFNHILKVPNDWKRSLIVKMPKKGHPTLGDNSIGVPLLSVPANFFFCRILFERIKDGVDKKLRDEQARFRSGRGTLEQIFVLRNIIEWQAPLYINIIEFKRAFDNVRQEILWKLLRQYGIPEVFVNIIRQRYDGSISCVLEAGRTSEQFKVKSSIKQGCVMFSSLLLTGS